MQKIIIDTDPGIDDAQAIAFAIAHPELDLIGLTTVFGNASIEVTSYNALNILQRFGRADIPVAKGASKPLLHPGFPVPDFVHGRDGLGNLNLPPPVANVAELTAAEFIVDMANKYSGEIVLVTIGPLTNIALAAKLDPTLASKIKGLVIMGGTIEHPGNVTPIAEANFINDPHAADLVLAHDWPASLIGLDVTMKTLLTDRDLMTLKTSAGETGELLWESSRFYVDFYTSRLSKDAKLDKSKSRACAMHDASALVYLVAQDAFQMVSGPARVINEGFALGQVALDRRQEPYLLPHWEGRPACKVAMKVDAQRVVSLFVNTIKQHALT